MLYIPMPLVVGSCLILLSLNQLFPSSGNQLLGPLHKVLSCLNLMTPIKVINNFPNRLPIDQLKR